MLYFTGEASAYPAPIDLIIFGVKLITGSMEGNMIANRADYDRLINLKVWTSDDGRETPLSEMNQRHLENIVRRLKKNAIDRVNGLRLDVLDWSGATTEELEKVGDVIQYEILRRSLADMELQAK